MAISEYIPQWTARMYPPSSGRDHLGLGEVSSGQILKSLSPSINVATIHPRYHSFYIFLLDEFWRRGRPGSRKAWVKFYRPRECIFSIGANLCEQPEHAEMGSIVGSDKTKALALSGAKEFNASTHYIKTDLGGYGLYYGSVIGENGLLIPGGSGLPTPIDVPTERGQELADAFRQAVSGTTYYKKYFDDDEAVVPINVVREYIHQACLCQLQKSDAPDRELLREIFLYEGIEPDARRETFRFFLDVTAKTKNIPIDQDTFRQLIFYGASLEGGKYKPSSAVVSTALRWRLYQAREYYAFALNALWFYLCGWGESCGGTMRPIQMNQVWDHLIKAMNFQKLANAFEIPDPKLSYESDFRQLLSWLTTLAGSNEDGFDRSWTIKAPLHEHGLYYAAMERDAGPEVMTTGMFSMLAMIYLRFNKSNLWRTPEWEISKMGADGRLSVHGFIQNLRRHLAGGPFTIMDFARWLYSSYIILQHQLVATRKLPDNTFRFRRTGDQLNFYSQSNYLGFNDSRFNAISTHIYELGFCGKWNSSGHKPTPDGLKLLREEVPK